MSTAKRMVKYILQLSVMAIFFTLLITLENSNPDSSIELLFFLATAVVLAIFVFIYYKRGFSPSTIEKMLFKKPDTTAIPFTLKSLDKQIHSLGFEPATEAHIKIPIFLFSVTNIIWLYLSEDGTTVAFLHKSGQVDFDSYFSDGFTISTQYPRGSIIKNDILSAQVVITSPLAALDYHLHACQIEATTHGEPQPITDWDIVREQAIHSIDIYRDYTANTTKTFFKKLGREVAIIAILAALAIVYLVMTIQFITPDLNPLLTIIIMIVGIGLAFIPLLRLIWMAKNLIYDEIRPEDSVEARKSKKRETFD